MNRNFLISAIVLIASFILTGINMCSSYKRENKIKEQSNLIKALGDTLKISRLKDSSQLATISTLRTEKVQDFLEIKSKDSSILRLQSLVEEYKGKLKPGSSVTTIKGETTITTGTKTEIVFENPQDTAKVTYVFPEYRGEINSKWFNAKMAMSKDTSILHLKIINDDDVVVGKDKKGWFADVIHRNPYSTTLSTRTYQVMVQTERPKRIGIGIQAGYGAVMSNPVTLKPYIGLGISYNIIRF